MEKMELPEKLKIKELYESYYDTFNEILSYIEARLKKVIRMQSLPTYKSRIKSFPSYYKKILRQKPTEAAQTKKLVTLTDMIGIRVICAFIEDLSVVQKILMESRRRGRSSRSGNSAMNPFTC